MKLYPSLQDAKAIASTDDYRKIPVCGELYADNVTPVEALRILKQASRHCYLLESVEDAQRWGRYSFLGFDPKLELTCMNGQLQIRGDTLFEADTNSPEAYIRKIVSENRSPRVEGLPPFTGGLVGYFSYDSIKYAEPSLQLDATDEESFKDVDLMLFDKVIAFDNFRQKIQLIVNIPADSLDTGYQNAALEIDRLIHLLKAGTPAAIPPLHLTSDFFPLFSEEAYCAMVEQAKRYIFEGDIFQVVLSNRLMAEYEGSLFDVYRVLRTTNPSPYMFYFSSDEIEIAGASPETLVKLTDGRLYTFPLAGTRPRGMNDAEDSRLEAELLADEKECAEHNMLVDLGRNDIGKLSCLGTVKVEKYMSVERFSHVMHIGSTVSGQIRADRDALDAVAAVLPAGTLSGAPKLRACEIINKLEKNRRGIYGGAIGYIDFTGNLDTCIAIRIAYAKNGKIFIRSGAGIVADSVPQNEYRECLNKARAVINAIKTAEEGID